MEIAHKQFQSLSAPWTGFRLEGAQWHGLPVSSSSCASTAAVHPMLTTAVKAAVRQWDSDGLALSDQLMAAYGPAMGVYGRYRSVLLPT